MKLPAGICANSIPRLLVKASVPEMGSISGEVCSANEFSLCSETITLVVSLTGLSEKQGADTKKVTTNKGMMMKIFMLTEIYSFNIFDNNIKRRIQINRRDKYASIISPGLFFVSGNNLNRITVNKREISAMAQTEIKDGQERLFCSEVL